MKNQLGKRKEPGAKLHTRVCWIEQRGLTIQPSEFFLSGRGLSFFSATHFFDSE